MRESIYIYLSKATLHYLYMMSYIYCIKFYEHQTSDRELNPVCALDNETKEVVSVAFTVLCANTVDSVTHYGRKNYNMPLLPLGKSVFQKSYLS